MNRHIKSKKKGFTLIELLVVIAIIGILAGIAIPTTGLVMERVKKTASQAQFSGYINAIKLYKQQYGYYPAFDGGNSGEFRLGTSSAATKEFHRFLTGRELNGNRLTKTNLRKYNTKGRSFYEFGADDFFDNDTPTPDDDRIADAFGNTDIFIVIDTDLDGFINVPTEDEPSSKIRTRADIGIYSKEDLNQGFPFISSY